MREPKPEQDQERGQRPDSTSANGEGLTLLKLGGALLTEKGGREEPRLDVLWRLVKEIRAWDGASGRLVLGHGSGSYAHVAVSDTEFLPRPDDPQAFAQVAAAAGRLNLLVVKALLDAGLPAIALPGSLLGICEAGVVTEVRSEMVTDLLASGLLPTLYGDAAPDRKQGGAIASTEPLLMGLAKDLDVRRIIVATDVHGVFEGDPNEIEDARPIPVITPAMGDALAQHLGKARSGAVDVTGGMASKVGLLLDLVQRQPKLEIRIVSGLREGAVLAALKGDPDAGGTRILADDSRV